MDSTTPSSGPAKRRAIAAAAAAAVVTALTVESQMGSARAAGPDRAAGADWHVQHFTSQVLDSHYFGEPGEADYRELSVDTPSNARGKTVGYNSISSRIDADTGRYISRLGIALKQGALVARVKQDAELAKNRYFILRGPVRGGVGQYAGAEGRVRITIDTKGSQDPQEASVRLRWRR